MKTFKHLNFKPHPISVSSMPQFANAKQAVMNFENGYGVSVIFGACFYSNGRDTYELAVLLDGELCYNTPITDDVMGHLSKKEVTEAMKKVQQLK